MQSPQGKSKNIRPRHMTLSSLLPNCCPPARALLHFKSEMHEHPGKYPWVAAHVLTVLVFWTSHHSCKHFSLQQSSPDHGFVSILLQKPFLMFCKSHLKIEQCQVEVFIADDLGFLGPRESRPHDRALSAPRHCLDAH